MQEAGHHHPRFQDDVFLEVLVRFGHRGQYGPVTARAGGGSRHGHDQIHVVRLGPLPRGVPRASWAGRAARRAPGVAGVAGVAGRVCGL